MNKKQDIPFHHYNDAVGNVQSSHGKSLTSLVPQYPFVMANFESMNESAQAEYPHRHDCYEVLYIREGEGAHIIDFESYPIKPNTFYFLSKDQIHYWQLSKPLKGNALLFTEEFLGFASSNILRTHDFAFFDHVGQAPYLSIAEDDFSMVNGLLEGMRQEFEDKSKRSLSVLRAYMHILFTNLNRLYVLDRPNEHSRTTSELLRQFTQLVSENFVNEHAVHFYADKMGISASHLTDTIKAVTGHPPGHIIRQKLVLEAKRILVHNNATIAEIGFSLNFEDASYFGRLFKRETGLSPAAFRNQVREKYQIGKE